MPTEVLDEINYPIPNGRIVEVREWISNPQCHARASAMRDFSVLAVDVYLRK